jgi:hypothetical protein
MAIRNRLCIGNAPQVGTLTYNRSDRHPRNGTLKRPAFPGDDPYPECFAAHRRYLDTLGDYVLENRGGAYGGLPSPVADFDYLWPQLERITQELRDFGDVQSFFGVTGAPGTVSNYLSSIRFGILISGANGGPNRGFFVESNPNITPTFLRAPPVGAVEFVRAGGGLFVFHGFPVQGTGRVPYTPSSYSIVGAGRSATNVPIVVNVDFRWTPQSFQSEGVSVFNPTQFTATRQDGLPGTYAFALYYQRPSHEVQISGGHTILEGAPATVTVPANRYGLLAIEGGQCESLAALPALTESLGGIGEFPPVLTNYTFRGPSFHLIATEQIGAGRVVHWASPVPCTGSLLTRAFSWCVRLIP